MTSVVRCLALLVLLVVPAAAHAETSASRIATLKPYTSGSGGSLGAVEVSGKAVFAAKDVEHGTEPWVTDGTSTTLLADLRPGTASSAANGFIRAGAWIYFAADLGGQTELWRTDGTRAGTTTVAPLYDGPGGGLEAVANGSTLIFKRYLNAQSTMAKVDGTSTTVTTLMTLGSMVGGGVDFVAFRDGALFRASDDAHGHELWYTDGTAEGTRLVADAKPGPYESFPDDLVVHGDTAYFSARPSFETQIFKTDGTTITPLATVPGMQSVISTAYLDGKIVLSGLVGNEVEPWIVDDTSATRLKDMIPDAWPKAMTSTGTGVYFTADPGSGVRQLFRTDGTEAGTVQLTNATQSISDDILTAVGSTVWFTADDGTTGPELWKATGTTAERVADLRPGGAGSNPSAVRPTSFGLLFSADDGEHGSEPHLLPTGGTTPQLLRDINLDGVGDDVADITPAGGFAYFIGDDVTHGRELFRTDGTAASTALVRDIASGTTGSAPTQVTAFGDGVVFAADDGVHGVELWRADAGGATMVTDRASGGTIFGLGVADGKLWFSTQLPGGRQVLFASDGTAAGTVEVAELNATCCDAAFSVLGAAAGKVWFNANGKLWSTDGTPGGTAVATGWTGTQTGFLATPYDGGLLVGTTTELWRVDAAGSLTSLKQTPIRQFAVSGDTAFFWAGSSAAGELWTTDGTASGTVKTAQPHTVRALAADGTGGVWFANRNGTDRLVHSDGTVDGTTIAAPLLRAGSVLLQTFRIAVAGGEPYVVGGEYVQRLHAGAIERVALDPGFKVSELVTFGERVLFSYADTSTSSGRLWQAGDVPPAPVVDAPEDEPAPLPLPVPPAAPPAAPPAPAAPRPAAPAARTTPVPAVRVGAFTADRRRGRGTVTVRLPRAGTVKLTGPGLTTVRRSVRAGTLKLAVVPGRALARRLRARGRVAVTAQVRYVPAGGPAEVVKVKLTLLRN